MNETAKSCLRAASVAMFAGTSGMGLSFIYLASAGLENETAGAAGFVAGAVLLAAGLVSSSVLAASPRTGDS